MKKLVTILILASICLFCTFNTFAQYGEEITPSRSILVDKMVGKVTVNKGGVDIEYVDNLSSSDPRFKPNDEIMFKIRIKNTSNVKFSDVEFKDYVPSYLEPLEGPGSYDQNTGIISFNAEDFEVDEEKIYYMKMKILSQDRLPSDKGLFCFKNKARAEADNGNIADEDTAQLCVEKQIGQVAETPSAGPEFSLALLALQSGALLVGLQIKKRI